jgi:ribosome-binding factor A
LKKSKIFSVKREQKKSFLLREISALVQRVSADEPKLSSLFVTRVDLSKDTGVCYVYFSTHTDKKAFDEGLEILKLYKPSIRKALASIMSTRYVPDLVFRYDKAKEKERRVTTLLDKIKG